jgi:hypothetical protein
MPLKLTYPTKAEIPSEIQSHYAERDGAWHLDVEGGAVPKAKLDEFRQTNITLAKERDELKAKVTKFDGIDLEVLKTKAAKAEELEQQLSKGGGNDLDKVIVARLKPLQDQLQSLTSERETLNKQLREKTVNEGALAAATKRGLKASAHEDVLARAGRSLKLGDNGAVQVVDGSGQVRYSKTDGVTPMTLEEWAGELIASAPHLFESNAGGGAAGNGSGGAGTGGDVNPWKKETFNLTKQGQLVTANPERARQLCIAAGGKPNW